MAMFKEQIEISAPTEKIWQILGDVGKISDWNPGVVKSYLTSEDTHGVGMARRCELGGRNYLEEDVVEWVPNKSLTLRITATNLPFKKADIRFTLEPNNEVTKVTVSPEYTLKYGLLGNLLDNLIVRRTYAKGMRELLQGLKAKVEA